MISDFYCSRENYSNNSFQFLSRFPMTELNWSKPIWIMELLFFEEGWKQENLNRNPLSHSESQAQIFNPS